MAKIAIMADSNCGLTPEEGEKLGISILPMPLMVDGQLHYENVDIMEEEFYQRQQAGADITSSQPSPEELMRMWGKLLETHDEVVYIPMSGSLSGSCQNAMIFAEEFEGKVHVVNNYRISVTQELAVRDAQCLAGQGFSGAEIKKQLEEEALDASIYISVDTLEYLKKGGRITPAAAAIGTILKIKPVLTIQGGKLDAFSKSRGMKAAFRTMCTALKRDVETRFKSLYEQGELVIGMATTYLPGEMKDYWKNELQKIFPNDEIWEGRLTLSIGTHTGAGAVGVGVVRRHR